MSSSVVSVQFLDPFIDWVLCIFGVKYSGMDKETVVYIHNTILFSHKEE